jgi:hypothetical protein
MTFDTEGGQFVIQQFEKDLSKTKLISEKRGDALAAFFVGRDKICILDL